MRFIGLSAFIIGLLGSIWGCTTSKPYHRTEGVVWNTTYHITYSSNVALDDSIQAVLHEVDMSLSTFNDSSLVSLINRGETDMTDTLFRRVFIESQYVNRASGGTFDPTVAPLVELWGFGKDKDAEEPSVAAVDSALRLVGIDSCYLTADRRVVKKSPATTFNFSAIAKGYGCDLMGKMFRRNGVNDFMVEIGGEILVSGVSARGSKWRVMIDAPIPSNDSVIHDGMAVIEIDSCGVATSGNYRNYKKIKNFTVGHSISPVTGQPVQTDLLSVTIVAPECITADAFATACMLLPLDSAKAVIERCDGVSALFVTASDSGQWVLTPTTGFPDIRY